MRSRKDTMPDDPSEDLEFSTGDRVELVFTDDPHTRLRPGDRGTVTGITRIPSDPPEAQVHVAWDSGSTLSLLPGAGDQLRKLPNDPADQL
jgi:hypothetical protein